MYGSRISTDKKATGRVCQRQPIVRVWLCNVISKAGYHSCSRPPPSPALRFFFDSLRCVAFLHIFPKRRTHSRSVSSIGIVCVVSEAPSHDGARDRDAAALVAVALDAFCLACAAARLGGLDDALDGGDGCCAGSVGHFGGFLLCRRDGFFFGGLGWFCCASM